MQKREQQPSTDLTQSTISSFLILKRRSVCEKQEKIINICKKLEFAFGAQSGLMDDGASRFTCKGKAIYHYACTSTFTEYTVVSDIYVAKVDARALVEVCLIGCGFSTGYGAAVNTAKGTKRSSCAVFGLGGVGFSSIVGCKDASATRIIGVGSHKDKYPKALQLGATECLNPKVYDKPIHEVITELTNGGVDFAVECAGRTETMLTALQSQSGLMDDGTSRFTCKGKATNHYACTSTFTEYTVVSDICVAKVDDHIAAPCLEVCLIGCGFATGYGAAVNTAKVTKRSSCAVFGLGGVGCSAIVGCKDASATRIIGVGSHKDKYPKALQLGATECLNPKDYDKPIHEVITELTNGGVDFAIECAGRTETMLTALQCTYCGNGVAVVLGVASPKDTLCLHPGLLVTGRTLKGSIFGGYKGSDIPKLVTDYMNKRNNLEHLVSKKLALEKINEAFELLSSGAGARSIVIF
ncbi:NADP-dependent alcohol dehydrogenase-like [Dendrobates tinctorius]|uniref:NADP-dependent alcohol dehydrogenase-like n=1 Tax=Dendrobates tinctorius TaxID=92724 RepID=UPI003CCA012D